MPSQVNPQQELEEMKSDKTDGSKSILAGIRNTYALLSATASAFERLPDIMLTAQRVASQISPVLDQMRQLSDYITNYIAGIQVPQYHEERKQQIVDSHRQWGLYGWSWFLDAPILITSLCQKGTVIVIRSPFLGVLSRIRHLQWKHPCLGLRSFPF